MSYTRKIRIEYYQVVLTLIDERKGNDKLYDLENILIKADSLPLEVRTFKYYQEEARLDKMKYNGIDNYWYLNFARLRQTKIPSKAKRNTVTEPMSLLDDEYIGEEVTAMYDVGNHIIALQRNRDSLSANGIEQYLTNLLSKDDYCIQLRPIAPIDIDFKLNNAKIYRKLQMKFAKLPTRTFRGDTESSFGRLLSYFDEFSANIATVTVSLGHVRKGSLDDEAMRGTIKNLCQNRDFVEGAELSIKKTELDPVDTIDLFSMKSHDFITLKLEKLETINYEEIADKIHEIYNYSKNNLLESLNV